jgi:hypothetical protein
MMYGNKIAAAIKVNGKVLREFKDTVYVPFGSEYTILIKNLHTQRAVINIYIDGDNVVPGGLVLNAGQEVDLERSIKNGNLNEGNKFKFIERTGAVEEHRGVKLEDGLIRIEHQFEQAYRPPLFVSNTDHWNKRYGNTTGDWIVPQGTVSSTSYNVGGVLRGVDISKGEQVKAMATTAINNYCADNGLLNTTEYHEGSATMDWNDVGITVPGSKSEQKFQTVHMGVMEAEKYNMVIRVLGETPGNKAVTKPVTVKHKPKCVTCGKQNKAHAKFCVECGTALEIFA